MPIPKKIINYLDKNEVKYKVVEHRKVYTAYDAAQTLKVKVSQIAKNLLVKADNGFIMAVLPADRNLDFAKLAKVAKVKKIVLPKEGVMQKQYQLKPGALPAFGKIFDLPVFMDKSLLKEKKVIFSSGSFTESIAMTVAAYKKLTEPQLGIFSVVKKIKKSKPVKKKSANKIKSKATKKVRQTAQRNK